MTTLAQLLASLDLSRLLPVFEAEEVTDLETLRDLGADGLQELGIKLGPRKRILAALAGAGASAGVAPVRDFELPAELRGLSIAKLRGEVLGSGFGLGLG